MTTMTTTWRQLAPQRGALARLRPADPEVWSERLQFDHERATSFGAYFFVSGVATLLASLGAGLIWDRDGAAMTFNIAAGVAALAGAMLWLMPKRS